MPSDRSRTSSDPRYQYKGVVTQQGRVIVDRDFNALQDIVNGRTEADAADVIGPCGTPDNGFAIILPDTSPPSPPLWSPPAPLPPPFLHPFDFVIAPGTMYVGGQRAVLPERQAGKAITYSYFDQPDFIRPDDPLPLDGSPPRQSVIELVYLHVFEQEVSAAEDPDLLDAALGGVDTTQRLRLMRRVRRLLVQSEDCVSAWAEATALWLKQKGLYLDPETMRLVPQVKLQVGFTQEQAVADPCDPVAKGGYLGADNQLIRVQISNSGVPGDATQPARLLWGYDNASFLYRVAKVVSNGQMLQLTRDPPDAFHIPQTGQVVEILRSAAILESEPDETDPTGQSTIVRCVAEATGVVRTLTQPYGPASSSDTTKYIVLDRPLPPDYASDTNPLFVRVWQTELSFDAAGGTIELSDPATRATTGIKVTLSVPTGEALTVGAFWMIAVRPGTPQAVYPERLLVTPQPPDGPREWACPLAVIDWLGTNEPVVHDCRCLFDNLVTLTKRKLGGCCTVSISPSDLAGEETLQEKIDRFKGREEPVKICLGPGTYQLTEPLLLGHEHSNLTIEACPGGVTLRAAARSLSNFEQGLITLSDASSVTLRGLTFDLPLLPYALGVEVGRVNIDLSVGLRPLNCLKLSVESCIFSFSGLVGERPLVAMGILAGGDCTGLRLIGNGFNGVSFDDTSVAFQIGFALFPSSTLVSRSSSAQFIGPWLDDAVIRDNFFGSLTVPIFVYSDCGLVKLESNTVRASSNGFIFLSLLSLASTFNMANVTFTPAHVEMAVQLHNALFYTLASPPFQTASAVLRGFPLPANFDLTKAQTVTPGAAAATDISRMQALFDGVLPAAALAVRPALEAAEAARVAAARRIALADDLSTLRVHPLRSVLTVPATVVSFNQSFSQVENQAFAAASAQAAPVALHIKDNDIDAEAGGPFSGIALLVLSLSRDGDAAFNMAGNTFIATNSSAFPIDFVAGDLHCTITGNIILNEGSADVLFSLWAYAPQGAITGNVLRRQALLFVPPPQGVPNWNVFNSIAI
ncbi:MAG: DUF6519 domain-containing protein [Pseudomonadota bacterium]|nr:DUF6519 domain-containing protein [Pseudomonadota bacterium]